LQQPPPPPPPQQQQQQQQPLANPFEFPLPHALPGYAMQPTAAAAPPPSYPILR
jgi:hypothetical protein